MKLSVFVPPRPTENQLRFVAQLGVRCVYTWLGDDQLDAGSIRALQRTLEPHGLALHNAGCIRLGKSPAIHLGLEGRDRDIAEFASFIRALAACGIRVTTFTWEPDQVWSTGREATRGGAMARAVDASLLAGRPFTRGRRYAESELWDNFAFFMRRIIPVAEAEGVRLALHPNDPPLPEIAGVPCLIRSAESYRTAFRIAASPALGMEFCVGCWLEGGEGFGDPAAGIREFGGEDRILVVHFRSVSSALPRFVETFVDDGIMDTAGVIGALEEVGYEGTVILDHSPDLAGSEEPAKGGYPCAATAYAIGYLKGLLARPATAAGSAREATASPRRRAARSRPRRRGRSAPSSASPSPDGC